MDHVLPWFELKHLLVTDFSDTFFPLIWVSNILSFDHQVLLVLDEQADKMVTDNGDTPAFRIVLCIFYAYFVRR